MDRVCARKGKSEADKGAGRIETTWLLREAMLSAPGGEDDRLSDGAVEE